MEMIPTVELIKYLNQTDLMNLMLSSKYFYQLFRDRQNKNKECFESIMPFTLSISLFVSGEEINVRYAFQLNDIRSSFDIIYPNKKFINHDIVREVVIREKNRVKLKVGDIIIIFVLYHPAKNRGRNEYIYFVYDDQIAEFYDQNHISLPYNNLYYASSGSHLKFADFKYSGLIAIRKITLPSSQLQFYCKNHKVTGLELFLNNCRLYLHCLDGIGFKPFYRDKKYKGNITLLFHNFIHGKIKTEKYVVLEVIHSEN